MTNSESRTEAGLPPLSPLIISALTSNSSPLAFGPRAASYGLDRRIPPPPKVPAGGPDSSPAALNRAGTPSPPSSSASSAGEQPSFSLTAPSGWSDSDNDADECASKRLSSVSGRRSSGRRMSATEAALVEAASRLSLQLAATVQRRVSEFDRSLLSIDAAEAQALEAAASESRRQQSLAAAAEDERRRQLEGDRQQLMAGLRTRHEQEAQQAQQRVAQVEAAAKRREEEKARLRADEERVRAAEVALKAKLAKDKAAEAEKQAANAAAAATTQQQQQQQQQKAQSALPPSGSGSVRATKGALQAEADRTSRLAATREAARPFVEDRAMRDMRRGIDKFITLNVQQISATRDQVRAKGSALAGFVSQQHGAARAHALLTLASKVLSQCEVQVTRLQSFAFPLAEVAVAVAAAHPELGDILLARLNEVCPLTVPKYYAFRQGTDEDAYLRQLGYKIEADEDSGAVTRETTDEYVARAQGYVMLFAAMAQSSSPGNPYGLAAAWAFAARLVNGTPPTRLTAAALDALLKVAGHALHGAYRGQFIKLLQSVDRDFLPELSKGGDADARAVYTRLQTYMRTGAFAKPPEGWDMPQYDASSYDRA